ncbi:hypothetical protein L7F22_048221 [Adiantum nelumboides]|nr:hypothetical protein [Adiantum nelumboides]
MKDCGPLVIERMIKSLQTASTQIPTNRQSRGSFSQLLPRPIRPPGLSKAPLRSSSFLGDWHSDSSTKKSWENYQRGRPLGDVRNKKGPGEKPALPFPDTKRAENSQKKGTDLNQQETSSSPACESSDALKRNGLSDGLNDISTSDAHYYILSLLGSAIQKAGSAGREGVKLIAKDIESQIVNDGRVIELKNWISGQGLLGFSRKTESMSENPEGQIQPIEPGSSHEDLVNMKDSFEKFQAERIAKLEAWLSQPDDNNSSSSSQNK